MKSKDVDKYINNFSQETQEKLKQLRKIIEEIIPEAEEKISYGIPTFDFYGHLVHFAAYKKHIGFYPTPSGIEAFQKELLDYKQAKGSVQFLLDKPLPVKLIQKIVKFRVVENLKKVKQK